MEQNKVPQDNVVTYANNKKAMYATNSSGKYSVVPSSGWEIEEEATMQAVQELERLASEAYQLVLKVKNPPFTFICIIAGWICKCFLNLQDFSSGE